MTVQIGDTFIWGGVRFNVEEGTLLVGARNFQAPPCTGDCSMNWRGYTLTWRMRRRTLYLADIHGTHRNGGRLNGSDIFPSQSLPMPASWFTGTLKLGESTAEYDYYGNGRHRDTYELRFEQGVLRYVRRVRDNRYRFDSMLEHEVGESHSGSQYRAELAWPSLMKPTMDVQLLLGDGAGRLELRVKSGNTKRRGEDGLKRLPTLKQSIDACLPIARDSKTLQKLLDTAEHLESDKKILNDRKVAIKGETWRMRFSAVPRDAEMLYWHIMVDGRPDEGEQLYTFKLSRHVVARLFYYAVKRLTCSPLYDPFFYEELQVGQALGLLVHDLSLEQLIVEMARLNQAQWERLRIVLLKTAFERMRKGSLRTREWQEYLARAEAMETLPTMYTEEEWAKGYTTRNQHCVLKDWRRYPELRTSDGAVANFRPWSHSKLFPKVFNGGWDDVGPWMREQHLRAYFITERWPGSSGLTITDVVLPTLELSYEERLTHIRKQKEKAEQKRRDSLDVWLSLCRWD